MKALILSDIHSNIYALEAIWSSENDSDVIYCAGDIVDYGPFPKETIGWIRDHNVICVGGNHDRGVISCYRQREELGLIPPEKTRWQHHNAKLLDERDAAFLEHLPVSRTFTLDNITYGLTHMYEGYDVINSPLAFDQFARKTYAESSNGDPPRLIFGHTHRQAIHYLSDSRLWLNPGSTSYRRPDDPTQKAHYATITNGEIRLKQVAYDLGPLYEQVKNLSLEPAEKEVVLWFFGPR